MTVVKGGHLSFIKKGRKSEVVVKRSFFDQIGEGSFVSHSGYHSKGSTIEEDLNDIERRVRRIDKTMVFIVAYAAIALVIMGALA